MYWLIIKIRNSGSIQINKKSKKKLDRIGDTSHRTKTKPLHPAGSGPTFLLAYKDTIIKQIQRHQEKNLIEKRDW